MLRLTQLFRPLRRLLRYCNSGEHSSLRSKQPIQSKSKIPIAGNAKVESCLHFKINMGFVVWPQVASCKLQGVFIFQLDDFKVLESIQKSIQKSITTNAIWR
mmetsp:Transcript_2611/g.3840  ORF Transcript_2611/g.3840 Transcript_2611/m.3840 type:complete len:102 (+) Transcript_2611:413-718(+)